MWVMVSMGYETVNWLVIAWLIGTSVPENSWLPSKILENLPAKIPPCHASPRTKGLHWKLINWHERVAFQRSGGRLVAMTYWPLFSSVFPLPLFFFSVATFSHRRSARIKNLIAQKLTAAPKNLGVNPFPDPVGHFAAPWRPFWILKFS